MPKAINGSPREHMLYKSKCGRWSYPWDTICVGDWFFVPPEPKGRLSETSFLQGMINQLIRKRETRGTKQRFMTIREVRDSREGVRVVRLK